MTDNVTIKILHEQFEEKLFKEGWMQIWLTKDDNGNYHKSMTQKEWIRFLSENVPGKQD
jgi:hypothetical protein